MRKYAISLLLATAIFFQGKAWPADQADESAGGEPEISQMLGSMLMLGFKESKPGPDFMALVGEGKIGNFILFDKDVATGGERNIHSPDQVRDLTATLRKAAPWPVFIGVDQEGGQVRRLKTQKGFMDLPSAQRLGQGNSTTTFEVAGQLGAELRDLGINLDLAPVVDVDVNPFNPAIGKLGRSFGTEPAIVAAHALAFGRGLAKNGVVPVLKHFPGQGCATEDSHLGPVDIGQCWQPDVDLKPYSDIFKAGWPGMVMVGHLQLKELDGDLPATLSKNIITGLLRDGLGWQGVVISDDLEMKAATQGRDLKTVIQLAIEAGNDILLFGNNLAFDPQLPQKILGALDELIKEGKISEDRIRQSWQRIQALHKVYGSR